jgi:hypothetical protein
MAPMTTGQYMSTVSASGTSPMTLRCFRPACRDLGDPLVEQWTSLRSVTMSSIE